MIYGLFYIYAIISSINLMQLGSFLTVLLIFISMVQFTFFEAQNFTKSGIFCIVFKDKVYGQNYVLDQKI